MHDEDGDRPDWIEIVNSCDQPQDLGGWHLTDSKANRDKWTFPNVQLDAHQFLVVFASGKDRRELASHLHTNFSLSAGGEYLALVSSDLRTIATEFAPYPVQRADTSYGFAHAAEAISTGKPVYFAQPTPGVENRSAPHTGFVADVTFDVNAGLFVVPTQVTLTTATTGASILYTLDGSVPTLDRGIVVEPTHRHEVPTAIIHITRTTVIRARAMKEELLPSDTTTASYIFPADVFRQTNAAALQAGFPTHWGDVAADYEMDPDVIGPYDLFDGDYSRQLDDSLASLPTLSLVMDIDELFGHRGIYAHPTQRGKEWERPVSVELIHTNGSLGFQVDAGIRIHGNGSRGLDVTRKKSFRLSFRSEYGPQTLEYPLFGAGATQRFEGLVLRAGFNDSWNDIDAEAKAQYTRDEWTRRTQSAMGSWSPHGTFVHLFINGFYWGLYDVTERPDAAFAASYYGGDAAEWDVITPAGATDGTVEAWNTLRSLAVRVGSGSPEAGAEDFARMIGLKPLADSGRAEVLLDIQNYIDYLILNFYAGTNDWPSGNWVAVRQESRNSTGFKFLVWDAEFSLGHGTTVHSNLLSIDRGAAEIYGHLRNSPEFRRMFADRLQHHFFAGGVFDIEVPTAAVNADSPAPIPAGDRFRELAHEIELAVIAESARWGDQHDRRLPYSQSDWRRERDRLLAEFFPQRSAIVLGQFVEAGLFPAVAAPRFNHRGGQVATGFMLTIDSPAGVWYTLDGTDPWPSQLSGPAPELSPTAQLYTTPICVSQGLVINARTYQHGQWSALSQIRLSTTGSPGQADRVVGDSNHDGTFDSADLVTVFQRGKYDDGIPHNASFDDGDWNRDGDFDSADFTFAVGRYNAQREPAAGAHCRAIGSTR